MSETELIEALHRNERQAQEEVYHKFFKPLVYFSKSIVQNSEAATDIVTEILIKAYRHPEIFKTIGDLKSWLYVCVRNLSINYLEEKIRKPEVLKEPQSLPDIATEPVEYPLEATRADVLAAIKAEVEALPNQRKEVIKLKFYEKKTIAQIAAIMKLSENTVTNHLGDAKKQLMFRLLQKGISPGTF